jgi:[NiFe] hydrogenase assembly HybE family chaperone
MTADAATADDDLPARLVALWRGVASGMADLPVYNPALDVGATAFRRHGAWRVGVVTTPWFMNLVVVPDDARGLPLAGSAVAVDLPAGTVEAIAAELDGFGRVAAASLFSPMDEFDDAAVAFAVADAALEALFAVPPEEVTGPLAATMDRRSLLFGRRPPEARP